MLAQKFDRVATDTYWLYQLGIDELEQKVVHLPLIYSSRIYLELEAYAKAAQRFPNLIGLDSEFDVRIVDDCVLKFNRHAYEKFKVDLLTKLLSGGQLSCSMYERSLRLLTRFSENCLLAEKDTIRTGQVSASFLIAYTDLVELISINLSNAAFEAGYLFLSDKVTDQTFFRESSENYLAVTFSHIGWFNDKWKAIQQPENNNFDRINDFFWSCSFLSSTGIDGSIDQVIDEFNQLNNTHYSLENFTKSYDSHPPDFDRAIRQKVEQLAEKGKTPKNLFEMLEVVQLVEEYRHYWQARLFRVLKLCGDLSELETMNYRQLEMYSDET